MLDRLELAAGGLDCSLHVCFVRVCQPVRVSARCGDDRVLFEPQGGFAPVKVTYVWEEGGQEKQDAHLAQKPEETYTIRCATRPVNA